VYSTGSLEENVKLNIDVMPDIFHNLPRGIELLVHRTKEDIRRTTPKVD
jgi:hypothetical protein